MGTIWPTRGMGKGYNTNRWICRFLWVTLSSTTTYIPPQWHILTVWFPASTAETANLKHLAENTILATAIPGGFTCATFTSRNCDNTRSSGKDDFHCAFNLQGAGNIMRWGVRTKPQCILCLRTDDNSIRMMNGGKYDRFAVELCEPHEDMVKERKSSMNWGLSDEIWISCQGTRLMCPCFLMLHPLDDITVKTSSGGVLEYELPV